MDDMFHSFAYARRFAHEQEKPFRWWQGGRSGQYRRGFPAAPSYAGCPDSHADQDL